jgi:hypothetical protein
LLSKVSLVREDESTEKIVTLEYLLKSLVEPAARVLFFKLNAASFKGNTVGTWPTLVAASRASKSKKAKATNKAKATTTKKKIKVAPKAKAKTSSESSLTGRQSKATAEDIVDVGETHNVDTSDSSGEQGNF